MTTVSEPSRQTLVVGEPDVVVCGGGPAGVETLAAVLSEQRDVIEEVIEPYLLQQGLVQRTPRGRMLASKGFAYLGLPEPAAAVEDRVRAADQFDLLNL